MALKQTDHRGNGLIDTFQSGVRGGRSVYNMHPSDAELSTQGLPKAFLHSLRTLFDILDDGSRGFVHLSEIESRWGDSPAGVLESLRRVAPPHGRLSFERFVAGLRNSMLNPEHGSKPVESNHRQQPKAEQRPVRPLGPSNGINTLHTRRTGRGSAISDKHGDYSGLKNARGCGGPERPEPVRQVWSAESEPNTGASVALPRSQSETMTSFRRSRRQTRSRDEPRRHTITNAVDYGLLKQMKELEQEKDSLLAGLDVLERAREWFQTQIHNITETQRHIGQSRRSSDFLPESSQSRLDVLLPKLQEVTECLCDLLSFSVKAFPSAGVTAGVPAAPAAAPPQAITILKEHNRLLTQEVTEKSERISQLEQEKSALIKQLFEARARSTHDSSALDSTFI